jgi:two-component system, OmpR family, phosphate regulon sensor histidine kinase PhoR
MRSIPFNKFLLAVIACLLILLIAQWYNLSNYVELQRVEFNKKINFTLETTLQSGRKMRTDSIARSMYRWLMDSSLTKIYSRPHPVYKKTVYYVEDTRAPRIQKTDFSLNFENRPVSPDNDTVRSLIANHVVLLFRQRYMDYESVFYFTANTGDSAARLSERLRDDTLTLRNELKNRLKQEQLPSAFVLHYIPDTDTLEIARQSALAAAPRSLQTRLYRTDAFHHASPVWVYASFSDPTVWLARKLFLPTVVSFAIVICIALLLFYFYRIIRKQKQLAELKNDFIDNMTHELKTPIATISAAAEAMQSFGALNDPDRARKYLGNIQNQSSQLSTIVNKVLNISTFDKQSFSLSKMRFVIGEILQEVKENQQLVYPSSQAEIYIEGGDAEIYADRFHLKNVFFNLIDNAIKYNDKSIAIITISVQNTADKLRATVKDNGRGIPREHIDRVFEKFYRLPQGNVQKVKGFGLGLFYVKKIIDMHHGSIDIESIANKQTTINIELPLRAAE